MTTYQSMMLSVCFGVSMGWLLSGLVLIVKSSFPPSKGKSKRNILPLMKNQLKHKKNNQEGGREYYFSTACFYRRPKYNERIINRLRNLQ